MGAHTPGPWRAGRSDMISECGGCGQMFKNIYAKDARGGFHKPTKTPLGLTVARAVIDPTGAENELLLTEGELFANARLIAAAPSLLEALTRISALPRCTDGDNEAQDIARAAIALATHNT